MSAFMLEPEALAKLLGGAAKPQEEASLTADAQIIRIQELLRQYQTRHEFKVGQLVTLKPGFGWYRYPEFGQPCIVVDILESPIISAEEGTPRWGMPMDIRLGVTCEQKSLFCLAYSATLQPYPAE